MKVRWSVRQLAAAFLLVAGACGGLYAVAPTVTLAVENAGMDPVTVYLDDRRIGYAMPGRTTCMLIRWLDSEATHVLSYRPTSGSVVHGPAETLMHSGGWSVRIAHLLRHDVYSLQPAEPCRA